jgi:hypothetical protein
MDMEILGASSINMWGLIALIQIKALAMPPYIMLASEFP